MAMTVTISGGAYDFNMLTSFLPQYKSHLNPAEKDTALDTTYTFEYSVEIASS